MTTEYIYKNTIKVFNEHFPELSDQLPKIDGGIIDSFILQSPNKNISVTISLSDRVHISWKSFEQYLEGTQGSFANEIVDAVRDIIDERSVFVLYLTDLEAAKKEGVDVPEGIPTRPIPTVVSTSEIPSSNVEHYFSNKIKTISWHGTYDNEYYAAYS